VAVDQMAGWAQPGAIGSIAGGAPTS